jgi:hypothetical protein
MLPSVSDPREAIAKPRAVETPLPDELPPKERERERERDRKRERVRDK